MCCQSWLVNPASVVTQKPIFEPSCSILDQVVLAPPAPLCDPKRAMPIRRRPSFRCDAVVIVNRGESRRHEGRRLPWRPLSDDTSSYVICLDTYHQQGKRVFIKDIAHYLLPPDGESANVAPSLVGGHNLTNGPDTENNDSQSSNGPAHTTGFVNGPTNGEDVGAATAPTHTNGFVNGPTDANAEEDNPTVMPTDMLRGFHWTFLIRHPRRSIPSYFRCTIPPLSELTGFHEFMPSEAGYDELRRLFDYLLDQGIIGPAKAGDEAPLDEALNDTSSEQGVTPGDRCSITVIDADDLLNNPEAILKTYCKEVGIDYSPAMLQWGDDDNQQYASKAFEKWYGFHHDAIDSTCLRPRAGHHVSYSFTFCPPLGAEIDQRRNVSAAVVPYISP